MLCFVSIVLYLLALHFGCENLLKLLFKLMKAACLTLSHGTADKCKRSNLAVCKSERVRQTGLPYTQRTHVKLRVNVHFHL